MNGTDLLSQVPLFTGLSPLELEEISGYLRRRRYGKNEVIFHQDDAGSALYIVAEGKVRIAVTSADGKQKTLAILDNGSFFGEMSLLDSEVRSADAIAMEPCQLLILGKEQFLSFLTRRPEAALRLLASLSRRLRRADELIQDGAFLDVAGRLAKTILALAEAQGNQQGESILINTQLTQGELATMVGATRESINKWLGFYQRRGLLRYERGKITVLRPKALRERIY